MAGGFGGRGTPPRLRLHGKSPALGGAPPRRLFLRRHQLSNVASDLSDSVGQILPARFELVLKVGKTGIETGFRRVYPLFQPLEAAAD